MTPFGPTDSALLRAMVVQASRGPTEAQIEAAPALLLAYCATPRTLEQLYPWGARRYYRPRMVRGLVRQLLAAAQLATDGDPDSPADWSWIWSTAHAAGPGAPPPVADLDRLTPPLGRVHWGDSDEGDEGDEGAPAPAPDAAPHPRATGAPLDRGGATLEEVAQELGLSCERVRQIETGALAKLAQNRSARGLLGHLDGAKAPPPRRTASILSALAAGPLSRTDLLSRTPYHPADLTIHLNRLLAEGSVVRIAHGTYALSSPQAPEVPEADPSPPPDQEIHMAKDLPDDVLAPALEAPRAPAPGRLRRLVLAALRGYPDGVRVCALAADLQVIHETVRTSLGRACAKGLARREGLLFFPVEPSATTAAPAPAQPSPAPAARDRLATARAAVAALSPDELDALMASLAPVVEARKALAAALAGLRGAA